jgi:hypothetical protein
VEKARTAALSLTPREGPAAIFEKQSALGRVVLDAAAKVSDMLRAILEGRVSGSGGAPPIEQEKPALAEASRALWPVSHNFNDRELAWLRKAQGYLATVVAMVVLRYVRHFRIFAYTVTLGALALLLMIVSYPFEPHRLLLTCIWVVMLAVVAACLWVYVELDQNSVMSRISGTEPGKVTLNGALAVRVLTWVVLPLLGVAAAQYPQVAKSLFQVVEPFAKALK